MAFVLSTAKTLAEHVCTREEVEPWIERWCRTHEKNPAQALRLCRNAGVGRRSSVLPVEEVFCPKTLSESNGLYREHMVRLGKKVARAAIGAAGLSSKDIDLVVSVSCTGFMIPSVDAYLIGELGMRPDTKRLPITEMGCAAGASALARAREYLIAFPDQRVLVLSVELPSLTFQWDDLSMDNLVSAALFGDGAAAAVLAGRPDGAGVHIVDSMTVTLEGSTSLMGYELGSQGFRILLSKEIPQAIRSRLKPLLDEFLSRSGCRIEEVRHLLFHPGGKRILEVYREELGVGEDALRYSIGALRECGNVSSSTVLMILDALLGSGEAVSGDMGHMLALGPGFSVEQALFRWV